MARSLETPFLQLDVELHRDPTFLMFASRLRAALPEHETGAWVSVAYLALVRTWERFLRHQSDGRPADIPTDVLEEWAGWRGTHGAYAAAFLEHWTVRDAQGPVLRGWHARYGKLAAKRAQDAERKRLARAGATRHRVGAVDDPPDDTPGVRGTSGGHPPDSPPDVPSTVHRTSGESGTKIETRVKSKEELQDTPSPSGEGGAGLSPDDLPFHLDDELSVAIAVSPSAAPRAVATPAAAPSKPRKRDEPKFPHFTQALRERLLEVWEREVRPLKNGEHGRLFATFGPFFRLAEADRPADAPRDEEVLAAVREILQARTHGGRATANLGTPEYCAEKVRPIVEILRRCPLPVDRVDAIDRVLGIGLTTRPALR